MAQLTQNISSNLEGNHVVPVVGSDVITPSPTLAGVGENPYAEGFKQNGLINHNGNNGDTASVAQLVNSNPSDIPTPTITKGSFADKAGKWSHQHKATMTNPLSWYGIRNIVNALVALTALSAVVVPVRSGLSHIGAKAATTGFTGSKSVDTFLEHTAGDPKFQQIIGIGLSFATFRTFFKVWKKNYDRIFTNSDSEQESAEAITNLPLNIAKDFGDIAPLEYPSTVAAAFPLVAIRSWMGGPAQPHSLKDALWSVPAYIAFFEMTERLFHGFSNDPAAKKGIFKVSPDEVPTDGVPEDRVEDSLFKVDDGNPFHKEQSQPTSTIGVERKGNHEAQNNKKPWALFTDDTSTRLLFRKGLAVGLGISAYITVNRAAYARKGAKLLLEDGLKTFEGNVGKTAKEIKAAYGGASTEIMLKENIAKAPQNDLIKAGAMIPATFPEVTRDVASGEIVKANDIKTHVGEMLTKPEYAAGGTLKDGFVKEVVPYWHFATYTAISELVLRNYDKLFAKMQGQYEGQEQSKG